MAFRVLSVMASVGSLCATETDFVVDGCGADADATAASQSRAGRVGVVVQYGVSQQVLGMACAGLGRRQKPGPKLWWWTESEAFQEQGSRECVCGVCCCCVLGCCVI